jgi:hypothetical protein
LESGALDGPSDGTLLGSIDGSFEGLSLVVEEGFSLEELGTTDGIELD